MNGSFIWLPDCDENGTPKEKMPNCPACGEDELGMMNPGEAYCYLCGITFYQATGGRPTHAFMNRITEDDD